VSMVVRFFEIDGDDLNADGGSIEVADDSTVVISEPLAFAMDLPAWEDPTVPGSTSTRPAGGFERVGEEDGQVRFRPVGEWDSAEWIDKIRYHFRTPYLRPGEVERT
jgi:hypothetical protein